MKRYMIYGESPTGNSGWLFYAPDGVIYPERPSTCTIFNEPDMEEEVSLLKRIGWTGVKSKRAKGKIKNLTKRLFKRHQGVSSA